MGFLMTTMSRRVLAGLSALSCGAATVVAVQPAHADPTAASHVVINEVYGGGGNSGATWTHDFVELLNPTSTDVSVKGWKLEYLTGKGKVAWSRRPGETAAARPSRLPTPSARHS